LEEIGGKSTSKQVAKELGEVGNNLALKIYDNNKISLIEGKKGSGYRLLLEVSIRE